MAGRELVKEPLSREELDKLLPRSGQINDYLNSRNNVYRELKLKDNPPSREKAITLILKEPNLLRRPVVVRGNKKVWGFDADALQGLLAG